MEEKVRNIRIISAFFDNESFMSSMAFFLFSVPTISHARSLSIFFPSSLVSRNVLTSVLYDLTSESQLLTSGVAIIIKLTA